MYDEYNLLTTISSYQEYIKNSIYSFNIMESFIWLGQIFLFLVLQAHRMFHKALSRMGIK